MSLAKQKPACNADVTKYIIDKQYHPINNTPLVTTSSMVDIVSAAMKPIVANMTNPARNAVHVSKIDIITASLHQQQTHTII